MTSAPPAARPPSGSRHHRRKVVAALVREGLAEERTERDVLPGLDVTGGPVVEDDDAEEVLVGPLERDGLA